MELLEFGDGRRVRRLRSGINVVMTIRNFPVRLPTGNRIEVETETDVSSTDIRSGSGVNVRRRQVVRSIRDSRF